MAASAPGRTTLSATDVAATVISAMVGAGIFITPGLMVRQGASLGIIVILFLLSGAAVLLGAWTMAALARAHPGDGGPYRYLAAGLGPMPARLYVWGRFSVMQCGALAVLSLTTVRFTAVALRLGTGSRLWEAAAALGLLALAAAIGARGLALGRRVQAVLTLLKVGLLILLTAGILVAGSHHGAASSHGSGAGGDSSALSGGFGSWILLAVFAFGGWSQVTFLAGQTRRHALTIGPTLAIVAVTLLYAAAATTFVLAVPNPGDVIAAEAAAAAWGSAGGRAAAAVIAIAAAGGLHTMTFTGPRLYAAAAKQRDWWAPFGSLNNRQAPGRGTWLQALWASYLVAFSLLAENAFVALIGGISIAIWIFHFLVAVSALRLRVPTVGPRFAPAAFAAASATVLVLAALHEVHLLLEGAWASLKATWGVAILIAGLPFALRTRGTAPASPATT